MVRERITGYSLRGGRKDPEKKLKTPRKHPSRHPEKNFFHKELPDFLGGPKTPRKDPENTPKTPRKICHLFCQIRPGGGAEKTPKTPRKDPENAPKRPRKKVEKIALSAKKRKLPPFSPPSGGIFYVIFTHKQRNVCYNASCTLAAYKRIGLAGFLPAHWAVFAACICARPCGRKAGIPAARHSQGSMISALHDCTQSETAWFRILHLETGACRAELFCWSSFHSSRWSW